MVKTLVSNDYKLLNWTLAVCGWVALLGLAQHQKIGCMSITPANLQNPSPLVQNSMHRCARSPEHNQGGGGTVGSLIPALLLFDGDLLSKRITPMLGLSKEQLMRVVAT